MPVALDRDVLVLAGGTVLLGGQPVRLLRLAVDGPAVLARILAGRTAPGRDQALAARLVERGLAHPKPGPVPLPHVDVIVPVRDRPAQLDRCLTALSAGARVLVVDDASEDGQAIAAVAARHAARCVRPDWTGPAGARNTGFAATSGPVVAFVDSDCTTTPGWVEQLAGHLDDPAVAAVAPRVRGPGGGSVLARYARAKGPLDLGAHEARARPGGRVPYVPTAALLVRRAALAALPGGAMDAPPGGPFDARLRYGEDVDLVWRLHDAGWTVRYDPRVEVQHDEPMRWGAWFARRHRYGSSAAPLAQRHPGRLVPLVVQPWLTPGWLLLAAARPLLAAGVIGVRVRQVARAIPSAGITGGERARVAGTVVARALRWAAMGTGGSGLVVTGPPLLAALAGRRTRRPAAVMLLLPPLLEHLERRPRLDPVRWTALRLLDDAAYATGVWAGCWRGRTLAPLRPSRRGPQ